ncbi:MAG: excinuclease ABC subunit UvrC [Ignavibacteriaceae bacterium]
MNTKTDNYIKEKIAGTPAKPGCYQYMNAAGKVIYVGKAKNLRNRLYSYFNNSASSPKTMALVSKITDFRVVITDSEMEALILENNLIKELKPRYNINLKDDKTFPYIRITKEPFPQIYSTRKVVRDGSKYIGPFTDVKSLKGALRIVNHLFKIRSCKFYMTEETVAQKKFKVCLDYHIKKCDGPCEGFQSAAEYNEMVRQAIHMLNGRSDAVLSDLAKALEKAVKDLRFEEAASLRDRIAYLNSFTARQKVEGLSASGGSSEFDIFGIASEGREGSTTIFIIRNGKLIAKREFDISLTGSDTDDMINYAVLQQYYNTTDDIPAGIVLASEAADSELLLKWLSGKGTHKVSFIVPKIETKLKNLLNMAKSNAAFQLKERQIEKMKKEGSVPFTLSALRRDLNLEKLPRLIECFDISTLQGSDTVASMVVFVDGKPKRSLYRRFIIKSIDYQDDFESMREVVYRRYKRVKEENLPFPDLIIIDGGKGQLSAAIASLRSLGYIGSNPPAADEGLKSKVESDVSDEGRRSNPPAADESDVSDKSQKSMGSNVAVIGLAKKFEEVFDGRLPNGGEGLILPKTSSSLKLLQQVRDEAHRFAVTFHRERRSKRIISTELLDIKGIGVKLATQLLTNFGSVETIKGLTEEALASLVGPKKSKLIYNYFNDKKDD